MVKTRMEELWGKKDKETFELFLCAMLLFVTGIETSAFTGVLPQQPEKLTSGTLVLYRKVTHNCTTTISAHRTGNSVKMSAVPENLRKAQQYLAI